MSDITQSLSDAITFSDASSIGWGVPRSAADTLALSDATSRNVGLPFNAPSDQLILADSVAVHLDVDLLDSGLVSIAVPQVIGSLGASVAVNVTLTVLGNAQPAAVQFKILYSPDNLTLTSAVIGAAGTAASKILSQGGTAGADTFLLYGLNENVIATGVIAILTFTIPSDALSNPTLLQILDLAVATPNNQTIEGNTPTTVLFSDFLTYIDQTQVLLDLRVSLSDIFTFTDSVAISGPSTDIRISKSDSLSFSDSIAALTLHGAGVGNVQINVADTLSLSDNILTATLNATVLDIQIVVGDTLNLSDVLDRYSLSTLGILDMQRSAADALSLSDEVIFTTSQLIGTEFLKYIRRYLNDVV